VFFSIAKAIYKPCITNHAILVKNGITTESGLFLAGVWNN